MKSVIQSISKSLLENTKGFVNLKDRGLLSLKGPDARKLLQGLTTNDVNKLSKAQYTAFLNAKGRMLFDAFVYDHNGTLVVETQQDSIVDLKSHLTKFRLRNKVRIEECSAKYRVVQLFGKSKGNEEMVVCVPDPRHSELQNRALVRVENKESIVDDDDEMEEIPLEKYHLHRMLLGVPEQFVRGSSLPLEMKLDAINGVDFRKGCYLGQELTIRTHHTGVIRKQICLVKFEDFKQFELKKSSAAFDGDEDSQDETTIFNSNGKKVGSVYESMQGIGLALVKLENTAPFSSFQDFVADSTKQSGLFLKDGTSLKAYKLI